MRDYGKVYSTYWSSSTTGGASDDAKLLGLYLMTCSHSTIAGVYRLPDGYVSEDLGWFPERVAKGFAELFSKGFSNRCETTKWVWITKHLEWNKPENPNQRKSAAKIALSIPDACCWKQDFMRLWAEVLAIEWTPAPNPSPTLSKGLLNQEQEQKAGTGTETGTENGAASQAASRPKREAITLKAYLDQCKEEVKKPVPSDHPIRDYCRDAGISEEMLQVAWCVFRDDYLAGTNKAKRYKDWPGHFANAVRGCWAKLWFTESGEVKWTSRGLQEKVVLETRQRAKEGAHAA